MSHWILIEAEHPEDYEHVVCGPFDTEAQAMTHLQDSVQVQGWCEDDAIDCWAVETDAAKDDVVRQWTEHGDNWGLYSPIPDEDDTVPTCDVCGALAEDESVDWCGECGCCVEHCQKFVGCPA